jgi:hypothetical protein
MNIIKLQNMLRGVADEALIGYVQNPQGEVPSFLALSELQRRKDTRAKYQAEQTPESSVAEDITQEAQPSGLAMLAGQPQMQMEDQGLAGLPVDDDMYQEDSFAAGGIIAFDDGGDVKHFDQGGTSRLGRWWEGYKQRSRENLAREDEIQRLQNEYTSLTISPLQKTLEGQPEAAAKKQAEIKQRINELMAQKSSAGIPSAAPSSSILGSQASADATIRGSLGTTDTIPAYVPPAVTQQPPPPVVNPYAVDTAIPRPLSVEEAMKRQEEAMKLAGVDPEFYKTQAADLLAQREALKADRSEAANMALIRAGLATMGGTSPFALVNLGKGAEAGTEQYMQDARNIRAENRLLGQADLKLKEAQNAQQRGDAQGAIKAIQEREALIAQYNHYKMTTGATLEAARISAGARTGTVRLPALYNALAKTVNPDEKAQIQAEIDRIVAIEGGGANTAVPQDILDILKKHPGTSKK